MAQDPFPPGEAAEDEERYAVDLLLALTSNQIGGLLESCGLTKSGTKPEQRERIVAALADGTLAINQILAFVNDTAAWGKQHVFLFKGPRRFAHLRDVNGFRELVPSRLRGRVRAPLPLVLPDSLTLASIRHGAERVQVLAVERREHWEYVPADNEVEPLEDGRLREWRAYYKTITRGVVMMDWDLISNDIALQISQLPSGSDYEQQRDAFFNLIDWLPTGEFAGVDVRRAISRLDELHENGHAETESHKIGYRTPGGRDIVANSVTASGTVRGEQAVDRALTGVRGSGFGKIGNFWFLPRTSTRHLPHNSLTDKTRVEIVGYHQRVNFPRPYGEQVIKYVLSRIRLHSG